MSHFDITCVRLFQTAQKQDRMLKEQPDKHKNKHKERKTSQQLFLPWLKCIILFGVKGTRTDSTIKDNLLQQPYTKNQSNHTHILDNSIAKRYGDILRWK